MSESCNNSDMGKFSSVPFGIGKTKPKHFREMLRIAWENRDNLGYALRILKHGVCDGCSLGTSGLGVWTLPGTLLCMVRLEWMRLITGPELDPLVLGDVKPLQGMRSRDLGKLGRHRQSWPRLEFPRADVSKRT